jgi:hypothetical protein
VIVPDRREVTRELPTLINPAAWSLLLAGGVAVVLALAALVVTLTALVAADRRRRHWHWHEHRTPQAILPRRHRAGGSRTGLAPEP